MRYTLIALALLVCACGAEVEPGIEPPQPVIHEKTLPPVPEDHGLFADVSAERAAIWIDWSADGTGKTSGYEIYRSDDSAVAEDGTLLNKITVGRKEPSNDLIQTLDTTHRDTIDIQYLKRYHYQVRAFNRSSTNQYTWSKPSPVRNYRLLSPLTPIRPSTQGIVVPGEGLEFSWTYGDQNEGGFFQVVLERVNPPMLVWSSNRIVLEGELMIARYPGSAPALSPNLLYRWRVKRLTSDGGASSYWQQFSIE